MTRTRMASRPGRLLAALLIVVAALAAPGATRASTPPAAAPITVVDDHGTTLTLPKAPARLISLAPSVTEILYSLDLGPEVVAVSSFNNYPPAAAKKEVVLTYTGLKTERIVALHPDLIVAAAGIASPAQIAKLRSLRLRVLVLDPHDISGIFHDIVLAGKATGKGAVARSLVAGLTGRVAAVVSRTTALKARPRVYYELDSTGGFWTAGPGSYVDALIGMAGGTNVAAAARSAYPKLNAEQLLTANPDVILLGDAAYGTTPAAVAKRAGWSIVNAVRLHRVYAFNDDLVSRPGPRIVDGLEQMAALLHPELF